MIIRSVTPCLTRCVSLSEEEMEIKLSFAGFLSGLSGTQIKLVQRDSP